MTTIIVIAVVVLVVLGAAFYVMQQKNRQANIERADQLRAQAAGAAQTTIAPAQERAAAAEAQAEEARARAAAAQAEAEQARTAAAQEEAAHEGQVRAADRLDPRVDDSSDDYAPQVAGTVDQQPTPPSEVNVEPTPEPVDEQPAPSDETPAAGSPLLPRRTPGAQDMPGKPIEKTDEGGGWFTRKDSDQS